MLLSRKWLNEFVTVAADDKEFDEAMTLSGSKVETTADLGAEISNVVVGRILSMERHPDSDHMWICQIDAGQAEPVQIVTGAWNIHPGDLVPVALHKSTLPGGVKIEKGKLRGIASNGMMCGLSELGLDERDFPYAAITAAAILGDYKPLDKDKPSLPADIQAGDKIYGPVVCARVLGAFPSPTAFSTPVWIWAAPPPALIRYAPTSTRAIWWPITPRRTPSAPWKIFTPSRQSSPTASATAFSSSARTASPATISSPSSVRTIMWWNLRLLPTAPTA